MAPTSSTSPIPYHLFSPDEFRVGYRWQHFHQTYEVVKVEGEVVTFVNAAAPWVEITPDRGLRHNQMYKASIRREIAESKAWVSQPSTGYASGECRR